MPVISVSYNRKTVGKKNPPIREYRISYFRADGSAASGDEITDIHGLFAKVSASAAGRRAIHNGVADDAWLDGGYRIEVERDGGLAMTFAEVQQCMLHASLQQLAAMELVEVVTIPKSTLANIAGLPLAGARAWAEAVQQIEPYSDKQNVKLLASGGVKLLLDAGLLEVCDGSAEIQHAVPRSVAYCTIEKRDRKPAVESCPGEIGLVP